MHLVICTIYEAPARTVNAIITTLDVCLYNVLELKYARCDCIIRVLL